MDCWSCGAERGQAVFCGTCKKLQPVPKGRTYFDALGLERRQALDPKNLELRFRESAKEVHPDRFAQSSPIERKLALEHTTLVNQAYRALKDPASRAEYLLSLEGVVVGKEESRTQDPGFLMEMLELQEAIGEAKDHGALDRHAAALKARRGRLLEQSRAYFDDHQGSRDQIARALDELRYLRRLDQSLEVRLEELG